LAALAEQGGSYLESNNEAKYQPAVVKRMMATMMTWHEQTPCPFGHPNNSRVGTCTWMEIPFTGCNSYPLPGKPASSCEGKPCPAVGKSGPCVCKPAEKEDPLYASYARMLAD
jgi:hypothetical protein